MKAIADELIRITTLLGLDYQRAASTSESATITHYTELTGIIVIYVGFGNATIDDLESEPYQTVESTVYIMQKKPVVDELAENIDTILDQCAKAAADIIREYNTPFELPYTLEYQATDPDLLVGYLMTFSPTVETPVCTP